LKLIKKLFSFSIGTIAAAVIGIISIPILTRIIEPAEYGIATIFLTIGSLLSVISMLGLDQAFVRFFYEKDKISILKNTLFMTLIVASILTITLFMFDEEISRYITPNGSYALLLSIYIFVFITFRFSNLILRMLQYGYRYSLIQVLQKVLEFIFILSFAFLFTPNHYSILLGTMITMIVLTIMSLLMSNSFWRMDQGGNSKVSYKDLLVYSYPIMLSTLMALLFQSFDKFFLNYWGSSEELGIYSAGFKLIAVLNILQVSFAVFWAPASLEQFKKDPNNKEFYSIVAKLMTIIMISMSIVIILFKDILVLFLGSEYQNASTVIPALILMPIMYTMSETTVQGINFSLKTHLHIVVSGISLIINIILSLILIPRFGMEGAAISVGIAYISFYFTRTYFGLRHYSFDIKIKETIIIISLLLSWIILIMIYDNKIVLLTGALTLFSVIGFSFRKEISEGFMWIKYSLKS